MAINDAIKFIQDSQGNKELRKVVNKSAADKVLDQLVAIGFEFNMEEFEESVNMLHVKCQTEADANQLMQTAMWFRMATS